VKRVAKKIPEVILGINAILEKEREGTDHFGRAMLREGYVGGYLQALQDVIAYQGGWTNSDGRFGNLWKRNHDPKAARRA
jgi:hypothetical protein